MGSIPSNFPGMYTP